MIAQYSNNSIGTIVKKKQKKNAMTIQRRYQCDNAVNYSLGRVKWTQQSLCVNFT